MKFKALGLVAALLSLPVMAAEMQAQRPELWFPVGEKLIFTVYWGIIPVGHSEITSEWIEFDGKDRLRIQMRSISNSVIEKLWPVDDLMESIIDPVTFSSLQFSKKLSEGRYRADETTRFDYETMTAYWTSHINKKTKEFPIEEGTRDLLAFMFHMRKIGLSDEQKEDLTFQVMADEKMYEMHLPPPKRDKVNLKKYGKISSWRIKPRASFQGLFLHKGDMDLWVSMDARHIVTRMEVDLPVVNVKVILKEVQGPGDDFWVSKPELSKSASEAVPR